MSSAMLTLGMRFLAVFAVVVSCGPAEDAKSPKGAGAVIVQDLEANPVAYTTKSTPPQNLPPVQEFIVNSVRAFDNMRADQRVFDALTELAPLVPESGEVDYSDIEFIMQKHGVVEPTPVLLVLWGPLHDYDLLAPQLAQIEQSIAGKQYHRFGVTTLQRQGDEYGLLLVALMHSHLELDPIPRSLDSSPVSVKGRAHGDFTRPSVIVTRDDGTPENLFTAPAGREFDARFSCGSRVGLHRIEVTAVGPDGPNVLANFPVWCNETAPTSRIPKGFDDESGIDSEAHAEVYMLELLNADRRRHGLQPLLMNEAARVVARAHTTDMMVNGFVAHISPTTGNAKDRVQNGGIRTAMVLENVARAYGVGEAHQGLMDSPGHRMNILSGDATHVGIGIRFGDETVGKRSVYVTQVFIRENPQIDQRAGQRILGARFATEWGIGENAQLSGLAMRHAELLAGGMEESEVVKATNRYLGAMKPGYPSVVIATLGASSLDSIEPGQVASKGIAKSFGVGIAQGDHPTLGDRSLYVVVLYAR